MQSCLLPKRLLTCARLLTQYRGQQILPVKGKSMMPMLSGEAAAIHDDKIANRDVYAADNGVIY